MGAIRPPKKAIFFAGLLSNDEDVLRRAAYILKETRGIETRVLDMHTVKPLDEAAIGAAVVEVGLIVTAEEHQVGGFGNIIAGAALRVKPPAPGRLRLEMVGVADRFGESGAPWELMKAFELTAEYIVAKALKLVGTK